MRLHTRIILIFFVPLIISSCSTLIMNHGLKNYQSQIEKSNEYKKANNYQKDLLYLNDLCVHSFPYIDSAFPKLEREHLFDSLFHLFADKRLDKQYFSRQLLFYLAHFENEHTHISAYTNSLFPYSLLYANKNWYLMNINTEYDSVLIGKRVVKINNREIGLIVEKLKH